MFKVLTILGNSIDIRTFELNLGSNIPQQKDVVKWRARENVLRSPWDNKLSRKFI